MLPYIQKETIQIQIGNHTICFFEDNCLSNIDSKTVQSFSDEWNKFSKFSDSEINKIGNEYFDIVDENIINKNTYVLDLGCGSGRWSKYLAKKVKFIEAVDPSEAVKSAAYLLAENKNVRITKASVENIPFEDNSFDFTLSLGVLHHIPDTQSALNNLVKKVKIGGYVLLYLYYNLDNRNWFYRLIFKLSVYPRLIISKLPTATKHVFCDLLAIMIYLPFIYFARVIKKLFPNNIFYKKIPLSYYIGKSLHIIRNDSLDRFGTPLEQRFSKVQIKQMMVNAKLGDIVFSNNEPYWHVIAKRIY